MHSIINKISTLSLPLLITLSSLLLITIGCIDWITGNELSISIFYLIPISISSWFINKYAGILFAVFGAVIWLISDIMDSNSVTRPIIPYWNALVMLSFFIVLAVLLSTLKSVIERENNLALNIQKSLLPQYIPAVSNFRILTLWEPAQNVSGDYYDFINLSWKNLGICLADVCGHGIPAALLMSNIQATFRIVASHDHSPGEVCTHLNTVMLNYSTQEKYTSFFYGIMDIEKKEFTYSNAGHPPPIIIHNSGEITRLSAGGILLGIDSDALYEEETVQIEKGDILLLYTDGIIETRNPLGEEFGEKRFIEIIQKDKNHSEDYLQKGLLKSLTDFSNGNIDDDITLIIVLAV